MSIDTLALISFHTCPLAPPGEGKAGGMNVYVRELSRHLGRMGIKVDLFTRCHPGHEQDTIELEDNVRVVHLNGGPPEATLDTYYEYLPSFLDELRKFTIQGGTKYQLVHSHYWLSGWIGREAAEGWGVPHVVTFHTLMQLKMRANVGEEDAPVRSDVETELLRSADLIIASSPHEKSAMVGLYAALEERIQVVPCGVDLSLFKPLDVNEARETLGLNGEKVIVYVGRIEPIKGLDLLLRSAAIMEVKERLKVLIIGGDLNHEGELKRLRGLAEQLGIEDVLEFVGIVDQWQLPLYYNAADVCVVPSHYESFGLVALEALACGTPVVACRVGGLPTVVHHGKTGYLVSWRCPEPFADSLEVILSSKGLQKSMGLAARERAEVMGWERVAEDILGRYSSL